MTSFKGNSEFCFPKSLNVGWVVGHLDVVHRKKLQTKKYGNLEILTEHLLAKLNLSNLVNTIFYLVVFLISIMIHNVLTRLQAYTGIVFLKATPGLEITTDIDAIATNSYI